MTTRPRYRFAFTLAAAMLASVSLSGAFAPVVTAEEYVHLDQAVVEAAVKRVASSVVRIEMIGGVDQPGKESGVGSGPTSGLIVDATGYIVTSKQNFAQKPSEILVALPGGARRAAQVVAYDQTRNLVLLKVEPDAPLPVPVVAPMVSAQVGQWCIAVGRGLSTTRTNLSVGIISAVGRIWGKALQTDARVSPHNYGGALIDLEGRVLGILTPLSPQSSEEMAGVEWYDSGIGFAVPLEHIMRILPRWKEGHELKGGLLGVSVKGTDIYASKPTLASVRPGGPAAEAGLKVGDTILALDGAKVVRQAQLRHQLMPHYAGDEVELLIERGKEQLTRKLKLVDALAPYRQPFLGVLPERTGDAKRGLVVRYVYPGSPAAKAELHAGDKILAIDDNTVKNRKELAEQFATHLAGDKVKLQLERDGSKRTVEVKLTTVPGAAPADMPPAHATDETRSEKAATPASTTGKIAIKIAERSNTCNIFVPSSYSKDWPHGVLVWLQGPTAPLDDDELIQQLRETCQQRDLILILPHSATPLGWQRTELAVIRQAITNVEEKYKVDRNRIVIGGTDIGATAALLATFAFQDLVRGSIAVNSGMPSSVKIPENEPVTPLAFCVVYGGDGKLAKLIEQTVKQLREGQYPIEASRRKGETVTLSSEDWRSLGRWVDSLDRL